MSQLRFDGQGAGTGKRLGGNANSANDYTIICSCGATLGVLAGFFPNAEGTRTALCPKCEHITAVDKDGGIKVVHASKEVLAKLIRA
jgi:hypothetical protein